MKRNFSLKTEWQIRTDTEIEFHTFIPGRHEHGAIAKAP